MPHPELAILRQGSGTWNPWSRTLLMVERAESAPTWLGRWLPAGGGAGCRAARQVARCCARCPASAPAFVITPTGAYAASPSTEPALPGPGDRRSGRCWPRQRPAMVRNWYQDGLDTLAW